jgi:hypothetical protein
MANKGGPTMITPFELEDIAARNPSGFTVDVEEGKPKSHGFAVSFTHGLGVREACNIAFSLKQAGIFSGQLYYGGWLNDGKVVLDISIVVDFEDVAESLAELWCQQAYFNLTRGLVVTVDNGSDVSVKRDTLTSVISFLAAIAGCPSAAGNITARWLHQSLQSETGVK